MSDRYRELMHAWKNADNAAKLEDQLLSAKFDAYLAQQGPLPAEEDRLKLQRLRQEANEKLAAAIAYLKNRS